MLKEKIFKNIISRKIPAEIIYQDELVTAFRDINPQAPTHVIIVPNTFISTLNEVKFKHEPILGRLITVAVRIAQDEKIAENGYRLIMNCNQHGGQEVYHLHLHLLGGCPLGPMLLTK
ncbi:MAG: HIT domain-containing protein [Candidatus Dasytiphilus stammeri]